MRLVEQRVHHVNSGAGDTFRHMQRDLIKNPGVNFPPPVLYSGGIAAAVIAQQVRRLTISDVVEFSGQTEAGWVAICCGTAILLWALGTFMRARTAVYPNRPARQFVAHGPYRFSRNPMYVALTILTTGIGLAADNGWIVMFVPPVILLLKLLVVRREERYLLSVFGDRYADYCRRVRRWV